MLDASNTTVCDERTTHLEDPSTLDPFALDELNRRGPKYGVVLPWAGAAVILSRLSEQLEIYKVSSLGYNNRLYFVTTRSGGEYVIKVCGRYWKRVKTETEVVGLFLAGKLSSVPAPRILAWDSRGEEFGVEYTVMRKLGGMQLTEVWRDLSFEAKRSVVGQLAKLVVSYRSSTERLSALLPQGRIGNFVICGGDQSKSGEIDDVKFDIGATLEGLGPWSSYKAYLRTQIEVKMESVRKERGMESMRLLLPRVEGLLESLDTDESIADSHRFVFTHGDLTMQNLLITFVGDLPTITAVLDWEWSGMFPAEEEFFSSFDFILDEAGNNHISSGSDSNELKDFFFGILEDGSVDSPRTLAHYQQRKDLYDLRENLFPWYISDCDDVAEAAGQAVKEVHRVLEKLNF